MPDRYLTYEQMNLINSFRSFASEMAIFKRFTSSCIILYSDCFDALFARLLQVPYDSFQQMATYLGRDKAMTYYNLVNQHIIITVELLQALQQKDNQKADALLADLYHKADELASYLASINPYWNKEQWQNLLYKDLQMTLSQALAMQTKDYTKSVGIFDQLRNHSVLIGDYLAFGIMQLLNIKEPEIAPAPAPPQVTPPAPAPPEVAPPSPARFRSGPVRPGRNFR